jgi:YD repeat-containing protein
MASVVFAGGLAACGVALSGGPADSPGTPIVRATARPAADPPPDVERERDLWVWQELPVPTPPGGPVRAVVFAPDGAAFAGARGDGQVILWDAKTLQGKWGYRASEASADGLSFSPDGLTLAIATPDGVRLHTDARPHNPIDEMKGQAVSFAPDGRRLAVTDGQRLVVRDLPPASGGVEFGKLADAPKLDGPPPVAVAWAPDGRRVLFIPNNKIDPNWPERTTQKTHWYAMVWGAGSGEAMTMLKHGTAQVTAAAWSADGKRIATTDRDGNVVIWDGETFKEVKRLKASGSVTAITFRADGQRFAAGIVPTPAKAGGKGTVGIEVWTAWEGSTPDNWQSSSTLGMPAAERVRSLAFAPDGKTIVAGTETADGKGGGLRVWNRVKVAPK